MSSMAMSPPLGGWNARDALSDMPDDDAVILDNWFPSTERVELRRGATEHADGMSGNVDTLIEYVASDGDGELFAANGGDIYDVTSSGTIGAAVSTGHASDQWQYAQMGTAAGNFVRLVNGQDTPLLYDGSTWGTTAITGPTATNLIWINIHQRRMWVGEKESLSAWYLGTNAVSGPATEFSLAGIAKLGGYIMAMGTWTRDGGDGLDDLAVFVTSEGEAIVYQGINPGSTDTWSLVGVFRIGKPIGRRCLTKAGSDIIIITQDGFVPLSAVLSLDRSQTKIVSLSEKISKAVNDAVRDGKSLFGWQPIVYPKSIMMIFNIPISSTEYHQYVFNTITGAPCRFTGWNARCFALLNDNLYYGTTDGRVMLADNGTSDDGDNIEADALQAFSYFKTPSRNKLFKMVDVIFQSDGNPEAAVDFNVDFNIQIPSTTAQSATVDSALWGISLWGIDLWGTNGQIYRGWRGVRGSGRAGSIRVRVNSNSARPYWISTNYSYVLGGTL